MRRLARLVVLHVWRQVLAWSGSWWFLLTLVAGQAIAPLIGLFVWSEVFPGDPRVASYYVALLGVQIMTASYENHTFSEAIYDGNVTHDFVKPKPVVIGPIGENLAIRAWMTLIGLPLLLVVGFAMRTTYAGGAVVAALPALVGAAILRFLFTWVLALAAFWTERVHAVVGLGNVLVFLLGGSAAPVVFLPEPIRTFAEASPFRAMLGLPAEIATGSLTATQAVEGYAWQLGWIAVFAVAAVVVWQAGVRRYTAVGA